MKHKIKLFTVKLKDKYIQVDWIDDIYAWVCIQFPEELKNEKWYKEIYELNQWEAKDLCWVYWDFKISIIDKEIELE